MFEDSLVESSGRLRPHNHWTTAVSFTVQSALAGLVLLLSLVYTDVLPVRTLLSRIQAPLPASNAQPAHHVNVVRRSSPPDAAVLVVPKEIPRSPARGQENQPAGNPAPESPGGTPVVPNAPPNNTLGDLMRGTAPNIPRIVAQKVRVSSGIAQGLLIRQVRPEYPPLALQARIQGTVVLQAVIGKDGTVQDLRVVSGQPLLTRAAIEAVKQWLYRPYYLNGEPVAVDTLINVNFTLAQP